MWFDFHLCISKFSSIKCLSSAASCST
uniref:Uncharacterized protein n=1 Tax=Rhizophora mucronata TaxID=61149 RepID=A0A2P2PZW1_RHIMU